MMEENGIVLEHLRHIRFGVDSLCEDMRKVNDRLGILNVQFGNIHLRMDRLDGRLGRIEHRLETIET